MPLQPDESVQRKMLAVFAGAAPHFLFSEHFTWDKETQGGWMALRANGLIADAGTDCRGRSLYRVTAKGRAAVGASSAETPNLQPKLLAKAAMLPLVNEDMDPSMRDAWLTDLATAAIESLTLPQTDLEQARETALEEAAAIADKWAAENKEAASKARQRGRARSDLDGDETGLVMAEQLQGAFYECNAIAQAIRALASSSVPEQDRQTIPIDIAGAREALEKIDALVDGHTYGSFVGEERRSDSDVLEEVYQIAGRALPSSVTEAPQDRGASQEDGRP